MFHSRSSSTEPQQQQQQTNVTVINDCENASQTTKEEEILEKSRQMLEESKAKNEQLAEQVWSIYFIFLKNKIFFVKRQKYFKEHYKEMKFIQHLIVFLIVHQFIQLLLKKHEHLLIDFNN